MSKFEIQSAAINAEIEALKAELAVSVQHETLTIGNSYTIQVGRAETARELVATLIGERTTESGAKQYRFSAGEGFDARFYDLPISKVLVSIPEGIRTSDVIGRLLTRKETQLAKLAETLAEQEAKENLTIGQAYTIKVGGGSAGVSEVSAVLLGTSLDAKGNKLFRFFYGEGFESTTVTVNFTRVVLEPQAVEQPEEPAAEYPSVFPQ